jgi:hypothetical protein
LPIRRAEVHWLDDGTQLVRQRHLAHYAEPGCEGWRREDVAL